MRLPQWIGCVALLLGFAASSQELSSLPSLHVREIQVSGELIPKALLDEELPRYRNRDVSSEELLALARSLTEYLIAQGYVNSGVILPDQKIENGVVRLEVVAGRLDRIDIAGRKRIASRRIDTLLGDLDDGAFNINRTAERLQLLEREPLVRRISAELRPSVERGHALLDIDIEEHRAYGASVGVDNGVSPNVGGQQAFIDAYHRSVFGWQDAFTVNYRNAEGYSGGGAEYRLPIANRIAVGVRYAADESRIVVEPFESLDIRGESRRYGIGFRAALIDNLVTQFAVELGAQKEQVRSFLLGEPFSFSSSDTEGRSTVVMAQFIQEWVRRGMARVFAVRSTFNVGLDTWDASIGGNADGEFLEWTAQGEWLEKIAWRDGAVGLRVQVHLANDELPAFRKYPLGGVNSVRGYRESLATRDNSATAALEWKTVIGHWPLRWLNLGGDSRFDGQLSLAPFVDYGRGWNEFEDRGEPVELASAGAALRWLPANNTSMELHYATSLIDYESNAFERVLADDGVHFSIRVGF
jgi:hemolysin activation/secretion protein